jgi:hypothetical protein
VDARAGALAALALAMGVACAGPGPAPRASAPTPPRAAAPTTSPGAARIPAASGPSLVASPTFDAGAAVAIVRGLAEEIGPREATSAAYARAGALVEERLRALGYAVRRQRLRVPAGRSWGVPVPAGETFNVVAEPPGFDPAAPHLVVGAHLDTVPQAPGANDNASGVAAFLELARLAAAAPPPLPAVFVAFAAEEPRRPGDDGHHYGSRAFVAAMPPARRAALVGAVSLDRIATGRVVQVCTGRPGSRSLARVFLGAATRLGVPAVFCANRTSDHWPFERAGLPGVRLGGVRTAEYHSPADRLAAIDPAQLARVGRVAWEALRSLRR